MDSNSIVGVEGLKLDRFGKRFNAIFIDLRSSTTNKIEAVEF